MYYTDKRGDAVNQPVICNAFGLVVENISQHKISPKYTIFEVQLSRSRVDCRFFTIRATSNRIGRVGRIRISMKNGWRIG